MKPSHAIGEDPETAAPTKDANMTIAPDDAEQQGMEVDFF